MAYFEINLILVKRKINQCLHQPLFKYLKKVYNIIDLAERRGRPTNRIPGAELRHATQISHRTWLQPPAQKVGHSRTLRRYRLPKGLVADAELRKTTVVEEDKMVSCYRQLA